MRSTEAEEWAKREGSKISPEDAAAAAAAPAAAAAAAEPPAAAAAVAAAPAAAAAAMRRKRILGKLITNVHCNNQHIQMHATLSRKSTNGVPVTGNCISENQ